MLTGESNLEEPDCDADRKFTIVAVDERGQREVVATGVRLFDFSGLGSDLRAKAWNYVESFVRDPLETETFLAEEETDVR
jgi:hypothetical protein